MEENHDQHTQSTVRKKAITIIKLLVGKGKKLCFIKKFNEFVKSLMMYFAIFLTKISFCFKIQSNLDLPFQSSIHSLRKIQTFSTNWNCFSF
jgi:hypothetical protein